MYLADHHIHSCCSPDSEAPLSEMLRAAQAAGLSDLCATDHCDLLDLDGGRVTGLDWAPILTQYQAARGDCPAGVKLRLGLELGGAPVDPDCAAAILSGADLDFVIGSIHNLSPAKGGKDFYFLDYTTPRACYEALDDYFDSLAQLVHLDCWDTMGHIIYPLRYMQQIPGHPVTLERYQDRLRALLTGVAQAGRAIEVNTWCGRTVAQWQPLLELYRDCGGVLITLGSDAHRPEDVGKGISQAQELLRTVGFRYFTVYHRRTPQFIRL